MFWAKRLFEHPDTDSSWVLSYGDLVTLLLAIFVMIAAMGDLHAGERFARIGSGVRQAFGIGAITAPPKGPSIKQAPTLLDRLRQAGFAQRSQARLIGPDDDVLGACDVLLSEGSLTLQIAGTASFAQHSAALQPQAAKAVRRIGEYLLDMDGRIEVRGHAGDGTLPLGAPFRDSLDLAYARARGVVDVLTERGIPRERLVVTVAGEPQSAGELPASQPSDETMPDVGRCIEIIVHAAPTAARAADIAGKGSRVNG